MRHCEVRSNLYAIQSDSAYRGLLRTSMTRVCNLKHIVILLSFPICTSEICTFAHLFNTPYLDLI